MFRNRYLRLVLALLASGILSFAVGIAIGSVTSLLHCEGEGLACNIDVAVGAYATMMLAALGPLIFGVTLAVATNQKALLGATLLLLTPLVGGYLFAEAEDWRYVGFYPYPALRTFLVVLVPPFATVLTQWFALRTAIRRGILT
jgi:hypothetical protein